MVTGEPYYGSQEPTAVPEYENTYQAGAAGSTASGASSQSTGQAQQTVNKVGNQVQRAASQVAGQAADTAQAILKDQRKTAAQSLNSVSSAVSQVGDQLRQNDQTAPIAGVIDVAATQIQNAANYLQHHNVQQMVDEVRDFARREPALFLGGAFVLGLLAARFVKASPEQAETSQQQMGGPYAQTSRRAQYPRYSRPYGVYGYNRPAPMPYYRQPTYRPSGYRPAEYRTGYQAGYRPDSYGRTYAPSGNVMQGPNYGGTTYGETNYGEAERLGTSARP